MSRQPYGWEDDAEFDRVVEKAVSPLRSLDEEIAAYDALNRPVKPFSPEKAAEFYAHLQQACTTERAKDDGSTSSNGQAQRSAPPPFGQLIRTARERAKLKSSDVASKIKVQHNYFTCLEAGERSPLALRPQQFAQLIGLLRVSPKQMAASLEVSMVEVLTSRSAMPLAARVDHTLSKRERRTLLEEELVSDQASQKEMREWLQLIEAVEALPEL